MGEDALILISMFMIAPHHTYKTAEMEGFFVFSCRDTKNLHIFKIAGQNESTVFFISKGRSI